MNIKEAQFVLFQRSEEAAFTCTPLLYIQLLSFTLQWISSFWKPQPKWVILQQTDYKWQLL